MENSRLKVPELKNFTPVPSHDAQFACMLVLEAAAGGINAGQTGRRSQGFQPPVCNADVVNGGVSSTDWQLLHSFCCLSLSLNHEGGRKDETLL